MAKVAANKTRIWLDQWPFHGYLSSVGMTVNQETPDTTALSDDGPRRVPGNYDHSHSHNGFFDGAAAAFDEQIASLVDDDLHYQTINYGAGVEGTLSYSAAVRLASKPIAASNGSATALNISSEGSGQLARGVLLRNATVTDTGAGTGINQGTTSSGDEYSVTIHVSGTFSNLTVQVHQSSDDAAVDAYALITGLANTFSAAGAVRVSTTAATEAWKRVSVTAFTGTDATITVSGGLIAGT